MVSLIVLGVGGIVAFYGLCKVRKPQNDEEIKDWHASGGW